MLCNLVDHRRIVLPCFCIWLDIICFSEYKIRLVISFKLDDIAFIVFIHGIVYFIPLCSVFLIQRLILKPFV